LELGLKFTGFAVGPLIGGIIIHLTGSTLSVFFLAVFLHSVCALLILFVLPESLTDAKARIARLRYKAEKEANVNDPVLSRVLKEATRFLSALTVLLPRDIIGGHAQRQSREDWNLFFLTMCYGLNTSFHVSIDHGHRFLCNVPIYARHRYRFSSSMPLESSAGPQKL